MDWITTCASCGKELEFPCDPRDADGGGSFREHCDACNDRFYASMREQFPFGQCNCCGAAYHPVTRPCPRCMGVGQTLVIPLDPAGPQWATCASCGGDEVTTVLVAPHEETLCGFPEGDGEWETVSHVDILRWQREGDALSAQARTEWLASMGAAVGTLTADEPDDIDF